jgi:hypothetical protein
MAPFATPLSADAAPALTAKPSIAPLVSLQTINPSAIPQASPARRALRPISLPFRSGRSPATWARLKAAAARNIAAPRGLAVEGAPPLNASPSFSGMSDSASICPPSGCQPPDGAVGASPNYVVEGVNTSFAVYQTNGTLVAGWPKNAISFFKIPKTGKCDPLGPFVSDPRAYYDAADGHFWVAILQVQGPAIGDTCKPLTKYWLAVSATSDPTGSWHVYSFNMDPSQTTNWADFTQIGFSHTAACFSGNMFSQAGSFQYAEAYCANKTTMDAGGAVTAYGFTSFAIGGVLLDTVHPVDSLTSATGGSGVEFLVGTYNINFGGGSCSSSCNGGVLWGIYNAGRPTQGISGFGFSTAFNYSLPPSADEPGCTACLDTDDTRIAGTPVYRAGSVFFAYNTAVNTGTQIVPGFGWQQLNPSIDSTGNIISVTSYQGENSYLVGHGNDQSGFYPEIVTDSSNNVLMVLDTSSATLNPSTAYLYRRVLDSPGAFESYTIFKTGSAATTDSRWGDFNGASWDGSDNLWLEGEYAPSTTDWGTWLTKIVIGPPSF